jgi:hypothetical protein
MQRKCTNASQTPGVLQSKISNKQGVKTFSLSFLEAKDFTIMFSKFVFDVWPFLSGVNTYNIPT